jgi:fructokinase
MIVCCGEALIDMIPNENNNGEFSYIPKVGGAVLNTSICLGRLGANVSFLGSISNDLFGEMIVNELKASNVKTDLCELNSYNTTLAFAKITKEETTYSIFDENSSNKNISLKDITLKHKQVRSLYVGGISLMGEPNGSEIQTFIENNSQDKIIFFDPNIRPSFIKNDEEYKQRFRSILSISDIIKVSDEDLQWLYPNETFDEVCQQLLDTGLSIVILTKGSDGAVIKTKNHEVNSKAIKTNVVDTIGAGDIFNGAFLFSLLNNNTYTKNDMKNINSDILEKSLAFANKVAAISIQRVGANPPFYSEIN